MLTVTQPRGTSSRRKPLSWMLCRSFSASAHASRASHWNRQMKNGAGVFIPDKHLNIVGDAFQAAVPGHVTIGIVILLEKVDINHQARRKRLSSPGGFLGQTLQIAAVVHLCQLIGHGHPVELLVIQADFRHLLFNNLLIAEAEHLAAIHNDGDDKRHHGNKKTVD